MGLGTAFVVIKAVTGPFKKQLNDIGRDASLGKAGELAAQQFYRGFAKHRAKGGSLFGGLSRGLRDVDNSALAAFRNFQELTAVSFGMGTAITSLVGSLGALVGGVISLGSAVLSAAPGILVMGGALASLGLAAITAKMGFSGVGKAVQSGLAAANSSTSSLKAQRDALRNVSDATLAYTRAIIAANEEVQQLKFSSEDAALAEKRAALELEKARKTLLLTQDLPPNNAARREAMLAFQEADLNLRKAKDRTNDLKKESERINTGKPVEEKLMPGAENTDGYKAAKRALEDAKKASDEAEKGGTAFDTYAKDLEKLTPQAQSLVKFIVDEWTPAFKKLKDAAGIELLPKVEEALKTLKDKLFPELEPALTKLGGSVGTAFKSIVTSMTDPFNIANLKINMDTAGTVVEGFGKILGNVWTGGNAALAAAKPAIEKFTGHLVTESDKWAKKMSDGLKDGSLTKFFNNAERAMEKVSKIIGNTFGGLFNIIKANTGPGSGGEKLLNYFEKITGAFEKWSGSKEGQRVLKEFFSKVADNSIEILKTLGKFATIILKMGADPNIKIFWKTLGDAAPFLEKIATAFSDAGPKLAELIVSMVEFVSLAVESGAVTVFFETLLSIMESINTLMGNEMVQQILKVTGRIAAFAAAFHLVGNGVKAADKILFGHFKAIKNGLDKIKFLDGPRLKAMYAMESGIGKIKASFVKMGAAAKEHLISAGKHLADLASKSLDAAKTGFTTLGNSAKSVLSSMGTKMSAMASGILPAFGAASRAAWAAATGPIGLIVLAIAGVIAITVLVWKKNEAFRDFILGAWENIKDAFAGAFNWLRDNWPTVLAILTGPIGLAVLAITRNLDTIVEFVTGIPDRLRAIASTMWDWITETLSSRWKAAQRLWDNILEFVRGLGRLIADAAGGIWGWITETLSSRWKAAQRLWENQALARHFRSGAYLGAYGARRPVGIPARQPAWPTA